MGLQDQASVPTLGLLPGPLPPELMNLDCIFPQVPSSTSNNVAATGTTGGGQVAQLEITFPEDP